ncbi:hypothetical protein [Rummeliibacillus pycnus]|uniref:hypothetical protein n=1 Tax=Rummeliibacillus pycnus TaxID=101070 RepID=UPI000C9C8BE5|nr:hypothetical protein [Rummeliibacillus pycnus]
MENYIKSLKAIKEYFTNTNAYRLTLARAYVMKLSEKYTNKREIMAQTNNMLKAEGIKPISYTYVCKIINQ